MIYKKKYIILISLLVLTSLSGCNKQDASEIKENENTTTVSVSESGIVSEVEKNIPELSFSSDMNVDILTQHLLPSFERMQEDDRAELVESLQVYKKVTNLGLKTEDFLYPEKKLIELRKELDIGITSLPADIGIVDFYGTTSEELQTAIDENSGKIINVLSDEITVTDSIELHSYTFIKGNGVFLSSDNSEHIFLVRNADNICLDGISINGGADYGFFVADTSNLTITNCEISGMKQKPLCLIGNTNMFKVEGCVFSENKAGGIYCSGNVSRGIIQNNVVDNNFGTSNWMAGIVLANVESSDPMDIWQSFDDAHHFPAKENLYDQLECPNNIILENNYVSNNNASGIYSDGAYQCYVINNDVQFNDKEGICLDYGTIGMYLKENLFEGNGNRARQTDDDLSMDFVLAAGRMNDGSAKSKLPGVSLDNTAYNILENNTVINNYGGGIKMVRTTIRTLISENIIRDNNEGQNEDFHFFGIELGVANADIEAEDMDYTPDFENIICRNTICGDHYAGVYIAEACYVNDVFDNVIMEPQMYAVEALSKKFNSIVNNYSNSIVLNEYEG